ncbi:MAG TPA: hypothetical protein PK701_06485 [Bacteroidales bacterium]|jgi:hypothetical protein|nr:hypothetical protein [Bacteroidales bacterium]
MKINVFLIGLLIICLSIPMFSEEIVKTKSGKEVLLKDNGTWEFVKKSESKTSKSNWDKILDEYDEVVEKYISVAKKVKKNPNDMSALTESTDLMQKCLKLQEKMNNSSSELDSSQTVRLSKIASKMASAMY